MVKPILPLTHPELMSNLVRKWLIPDMRKSSLTKLPANLIGVIRHFTPEEGAAVRSLDPLLFSAIHPKTSNYLWYSVQQVYEEPDGRKSWDALVLISWLIKDPEKDAIPPTNQLMIANMKEKAQAFAEPLKSLVLGIPDDSNQVTPFTLADFPNMDWTSNGRVTLAGDAAHAMTMYRGEGANHGILDAALLVDQLVKVKEGKISQEQAIAEFENEMKERGTAAVLKSRKAALDGHCWDDINDDSPLVRGRWPPATA
jgi:2-polyprenyl-6-methoxyphenol hydroxylase-like FAD-dependent oxidoreductase